MTDQYDPKYMYGHDWDESKGPVLLKVPLPPGMRREDMEIFYPTTKTGTSGWCKDGPHQVIGEHLVIRYSNFQWRCIQVDSPGRLIVFTTDVVLPFSSARRLKRNTREYKTMKALLEM